MASSTSRRAREAEAAALGSGGVSAGEVQVSWLTLPPSLAVACIIGDNRGDDNARRLRGAVTLACGDLAAAAAETMPCDIARRVCIELSTRIGACVRVLWRLDFLFVFECPEEFLSKRVPSFPFFFFPFFFPTSTPPLLPPFRATSFIKRNTEADTAIKVTGIKKEA